MHSLLSFRTAFSFLNGVETLVLFFFLYLQCSVGCNAVNQSFGTIQEFIRNRLKLVSAGTKTLALKHTNIFKHLYGCIHATVRLYVCFFLFDGCHLPFVWTDERTNERTHVYLQ